MKRTTISSAAKYFMDSYSAQMPQSETRLTVGVDDGAAMTKVVVYDGAKLITQISIPSRARSGALGTTLIGNLNDKTASPGYETEGEQYYVGDFRDSETARFDSYPFSGMNRAIVAHALRVAGLGGKPLDIATGLPLSIFFQGASPNESIIAKKKQSLAKPIVALDGSPIATFVRNEVYPEGLAAFIDYAVSSDGELQIDLDDETFAVIDIGGRTTDIAVVVPRATVDHSRSGSENIGVLDLIEAIGAELKKEYDTSFPAHAIDAALRTRSIKAWGKKKDIGAVIDSCAKDVLARIMREVNRRLGNGVDVDRIILVGGGARVFSTITEQYPHIHIPDEPEFANARGFAKYMSL